VIGATTRPLRDVISPRNDIVHPRENPTGIAAFVGLEHIEPNTGRRIGAAPIDLGLMTGRKARFLPGDIVYGYLRPYLNKVWIAEFTGFCSVDQYVFIVTEAIADAGYVASYLRSPAYLAAAPIDETPGQLPRIRIEEVLSTPIPLPPLDEQRRIAARLREQLHEVDGLVASAIAQDEALARLRTRVYEAAFPVTPTIGDGRAGRPGWVDVAIARLARPARKRPHAESIATGLVGRRNPLDSVARHSRPRRAIRLRNAGAHQPGGDRPLGGTGPPGWHRRVVAHGVCRLRDDHGPTDGDEPGLRELGLRAGP
jgi:hypothetical protein